MIQRDTKAELSAIAQAPDESAREVLVHEFISTRKRFFTQVAAQICHTYGYSINNDLDDAYQITCLVAFNMLTKVIDDPVQIEKIYVSWEGMLRKNARTKVREFMDKNSSVASGMSGQARRRRTLRAVRDRLRHEMQMEPDDQLVVDVHNAEMLERRVDAGKQSMLATVEDLHTHRDWVEVPEDLRADDGGDDFVLHPSEGPKFLARLRARCVELDRKVLQDASAKKRPVLDNPLTVVADAWFGPLYSNEYGEPRMGTAKEIAEALGVPRTSARKYIFKVRETAMALASEEFGITADAL